MKWVDSHTVEGTEPVVKVGRPARRDSTTSKDKAYRVYHERYTVDGKQVSHSLKTGNKKEAIRRVIERQTKRREGVEAKAVVAPVRPITIRQGLAEYLRVCRDRNLAPKTLEKYDLTIRQLQACLGKKTDGPAADFSTPQFWAYDKYMRDAGHKDKTRYDRLIIIKQAFKYLAREERIPRFRLASITMSKPEWDQQPFFTVDQIKQLLAKADDYHRPIFVCMAYTGMRFGEVRDLQWEDLLLDEGTCGFVRISRGGSGDKTKSKRSRRLPIHPTLREVFDDLPRRGERVFYQPLSWVKTRGPQPLQQKKLLASLKALCKQCGFTDPKQYKLHSFRHTFASMCARNNVSYKYALDWLGHTDSAILDLYYRMFDEAAETAIVSIDYGEVVAKKQKEGAHGKG